MKKFIITIILALVASLSFTANAQIKVEKGERSIKEICNISLYWQWLYERTNSDGGKSYLLAMKSTNQFDDDFYWLDLGSTKEEALESAEALSEMLEGGKKGDVYTLLDMYGEKIVASVVSGMFGTKEIWFTDSGHRYAGHAQTEKTQIAALKKRLMKL